MRQRTLTSLAILSVSLLVVIFSKYLIYPIAVSFLAVTAVFEMLRVMGRHKNLSVAIPAYLLAAILPIISYFVTPESCMTFILAVAAIMFMFMLYLLGVSIFSKRSIPFSSISEVFISVTYVTVSLVLLSLLRYFDKRVGVFEVVLVFVVAWICDVFAFLVGSAIGKHKLIPEISPKKTVEGALGGIVFTAIACLVYGLLLELVVDGIEVNYIFLAIIGVVLPIVAQLGDLVASLIKREYGIKDYGKIFPGHGGVMDRFDSVIALSPVLFILCLIFPPFSLI
jgi:phosphatidate cytidylyltransferase